MAAARPPRAARRAPGRARGAAPRRLPRRVYWVRRLVVLALLLGVGAGATAGLGRLLGGYAGDDAAESRAGARPVAADPQRRPAPRGAVIDPEVQRAGRPQPTPRQVLARPDGPCDPADVVVTPRVPEAHAGGEVRIVLELTTLEAAACHWQVSSRTVYVVIASEAGPTWSSQQCPASVPVADTVPREERPDRVVLRWDARKSDVGCTPARDWVLEGSYTVAAVARGSAAPVEAEFVLLPPLRPTKTRTPTPTPTPTSTPTGSPAAERQDPQT